MRPRVLAIVLIMLCGIAPAQSVLPEKGYYNVSYSWKYKEVQWSFSVGVPKKVYDSYRKRAHDIDNLMLYVLSEYDRDYIREIVKSFREGGEEWGLSDLDNVFNVVSFVQSLQYVSDASSRGEDEYIRYPLETLVDGLGDCEDVVILAAAILHEMGYGVLLVQLPEHLALAVKYDKSLRGTYYLYKGDRYYYLEMTDSGWGLGQMPQQYKSAEAKLIPLVNRPVVRLGKCGFHYDSYYTSVPSVEFNLECSVENIGPGRTQGLSMRVVVKPYSRSKPAFAQKVFTLEELPETGKTTFHLKLPVPRPAHGIVEFHLEGENFDGETIIVEGVDLK